MNARDATAIVVDTIEAAGLTINRQKRAAIGAYAKTLQEGGATDAQLTAWANHYGGRMAQGAKIRPSQAWADVVDGIGGDAQAEIDDAQQRHALAKKRAADRRVTQALEMGLIDRDPRDPLTPEEIRRARSMDDGSGGWRKLLEEAND
jgi:thioredoxin-like negative regulator of GroEL